jgi:hypothetical protein
LRSSRTDACVRPISSRRREFILARSAAMRSCEERVSWASLEYELSSSERSLAKSTFWVYVARSESGLYVSNNSFFFDEDYVGIPSFRTIVLVRF